MSSPPGDSRCACREIRTDSTGHQPRCDGDARPAIGQLPAPEVADHRCGLRVAGRIRRKHPPVHACGERGRYGDPRWRLLVRAAVVDLEPVVIHDAVGEAACAESASNNAVVFAAAGSTTCLMPSTTGGLPGRSRPITSRGGCVCGRGHQRTNLVARRFRMSALIGM